MAILPQLSTATKIVAASLKIVKEKGHEGQEQEVHKYIIAFPGTPDADGNYDQPTRDLGGKLYVYETLYTAIIEEKGIYLGKTVAEIGKYGRARAAVEPEILREIAGKFNGTVVESRVMLP